MILSTHAVVGAALASFVPEHPIAAAVLGFASHFAIDAIPHWDYPLRSASVRPNNHGAMSYDGALLRDVSVVAFDGMAGLLIALALFASPSTLIAIALGAIAAMLPDPLQFLHNRYPHGPLRALQRFHRWCHTNVRLNDRPVLGVGSQVLFALIVVAAAFLAHRLTGDAATVGWHSF